MTQCVGVTKAVAVNTDFGCLLGSVMIFLKRHKHGGQVEPSETGGAAFYLKLDRNANISSSV